MKNGKYCIGIVGTGGIATSTHIPGWKKLKDVEIIAACDLSEKARERVKKEFNIPMIFSDYTELVKVEEIDIVDICAPNALHYPVTISALKNGKHVICEKPLAIKAQEVEEMIKASKTYKKKLMCAQHQRFRPESEIVKKIIDDGKFGEIYFSNIYAVRRRFLPPAPTFIKKELSGGGPLFDIGVHILDLTYWLMGSPLVESVYGLTFTKFGKNKNIANLWGQWDRKMFDVEDFAAGFVKFSDGRGLNLTCSWISNIENPEDFSAQLYGTKSGIHWPKLKIFTEENKILKDIELKVDIQNAEHPHHKEIRLFLESVKNNEGVPVKPEETYEVTKILEGIYKSAEKKKEITF
jgi:predicted dehydrogenase